MLTLLLLICFCSVFFKLFGFAIRAAWGIGKMIFFFAFLPLFIIGFLIAGIINVVIPVLVIMGIVCLVKSLAVAN